MPEMNTLSEQIVSGDRIALAKAITLIESSRKSDREKSAELLSFLLPKTGNSLRIGITGIPGVGKSTFIESLGNLITKSGKKLAVLSIDPSSPQSRGSILGDKTRMQTLSVNPNAFIRPSASSGSLGGVTSQTMEAILLCEAAGYEIIIVETVGVGQSEVAVKNMTDIFLLLMLAGAGDELQGIKRGIMEMADLVIINKADGNNLASSKQAQKTYANALHLFSTRATGWQPPVFTCSSITGDGIEKIWQGVNTYFGLLKKDKNFEQQRKAQQKHWLDQTINTILLGRLKENKAVKKLLEKLEDDVLNDRTTPARAAAELIDKFLSSERQPE